jgi:hypothetical protein
MTEFKTEFISDEELNSMIKETQDIDKKIRAIRADSDKVIQDIAVKKKPFFKCAICGKGVRIISGQENFRIGINNYCNVCSKLYIYGVSVALPSSDELDEFDEGIPLRIVSRRAGGFNDEQRSEYLGITDIKGKMLLTMDISQSGFNIIPASGMLLVKKDNAIFAMPDVYWDPDKSALLDDG